MDRTIWEPVLLGITSLVVVVLPWRVHVSAARRPRRWLTSPDLLMSLTILAAYAWSLLAIVDGRSPTHVLPTVVTAILASVAASARSRSRLDLETTAVPFWFVPAVLLSAAAGAITWAAADGAATGGRVGVATLVMAGPAAIALASPLAYHSGARRARAAGVRLEGLDALSAANRVDTLVLQKDGTVTTGDLTVVAVDPVDPDHDRNLRWFAGALEKASDHRVGKAVATLSARGQLSDVEVVDGHGIQGSVDRHPVRVGSPAWIGIETAPTIWTTVGVEVDGRALGSITVADDVRADLAGEVSRLSDLGLHLVLVSADTDERTRHVAGLAGIETSHSGCTPDAMQRIVRDLADEGRTVATAGVVEPTGAPLAFTADGSQSSPGPALVLEDVSPASVRRALQTARSVHHRVHRAGHGAVALGLLGAAAGLTGVAGPLAAAITAAVSAVLTAVIATSA